MRVILPESGRRRKRKIGGPTVSVALHALVIGGVVAASGLRAEAPPRRVTPPPLVYVKQSGHQDPAPRPREARPAPPLAPRPMVPPDVPLLPTIEPLVIADSRAIPSVLPAIDAPLGAVSSGTANTLDNSLPASNGREGGTTGEAPLTALTVEREVHPLGATTLRYPPLLQGAGVEGEVVLQYVVDTLSESSNRPSSEPATSASTPSNPRSAASGAISTTE